MEGLADISRVNNLISWWFTNIKANNAINFTDINKLAEGVAKKLLNEIYDYQLDNLNYEKPNYPGVDLGDKRKKIAFQITSRKDARKLKDDLGKFAKGASRIYENGIYFLILSQERKPHLDRDKYKAVYSPFDPEKHILNGTDLIKDIRRIFDEDRQKFHRIKLILETEIAGKAMKRENLNEEAIQSIRENISCYVYTEFFVTPEVSFRPSASNLGKKTDVIQTLADIDRAIIIGEIGLGKTTLCFKYLAEKETLEKFHIPLLISLKIYKSILNVSSMIRDTFKSMGLKIDEGTLEYLLKDKKRFSFIFDGFNEISRDNRDYFVQAISQFCELNPNHQVIVTCRSEYYNNEFKNFSEIRLLPWGEFQVKEYLKQAVDSEAVINEFLSKSRLNHEHRFMLSRPFFLTHLVNEYKKEGEFPNDRTTLLRRIMHRRLGESGTDGNSLGLAADLKLCLAEIAFGMQKNFSMTIELEDARKQIRKWFFEKGKRDGCGYSLGDLWEAFLKTGFLQYDVQQISFIHEMWQDFFASLYFRDINKKENIEILELAVDSWWNDALIFLFNDISEDRINEILERARNKGNLKLLGFALRREAGINANQIAQRFVTSFLASGNLAERARIYEMMQYAADTPWCIKVLLDLIDEEQSLILKELGESYFDELPLSTVMPGYRAYHTLSFCRGSHFSPLPLDALDEILDVTKRTPLARLVSTEILASAIGIIKDSDLIRILEERAKDPICRVREAVVCVLEQFWWRRMEHTKQDTPTYMRIVSILQSQGGFDAYRLLNEMGAVDRSDWVAEQCNAVLAKVDSAISEHDPEFGYRIVSSQFEDIVGDPYIMAFQILPKHEKSQLLRLTIDHIIQNRERFEDESRKYNAIIATDTNRIERIERQAQVIKEVPELLWNDFGLLVSELGKIANQDDIWRFNELVTKTPLIWERQSSWSSQKIELLWRAAEALENIGGEKAQEVLEGYLKTENEIAVMAALALVLGELHKKWEVSSIGICACRNSVKRMKPGDFLSIFISLNRIYLVSAELTELFFNKYGKDKIREMVRKVLETDTEKALEFLELYRFFLNPEDLKRVINDPSKVLSQERIKKLLKKSRH